MKINLKLLICALILLQQGNAQTINPQHNTLFTAGYAHAFIGGLYNGYYPYHKLKQHGDFGLGAPDKLDGELLVLNGKIYQTQHTGKTFEVNNKALTPYAVVNFFKPEKTIKLSRAIDRVSLYKYLDSVLQNSNGMHAIHIQGKFSTIKTRAFPPVASKPYRPLADMLNLQQFFSYAAINGDLVGYKLPEYMDGANITGYHFHFLSQDKKSGGHIIDFTAENLIIEIDYLNSFTVDIPQTAEFNTYDFKKDRRKELESVESGKKH
jgi:acetolactate decarboxylase